MRIASAALLLATILIFPATAPAQPAVQGVTEFTVNGLKVLVKQRPASQTVAAGLFIKGGARNVTAANAGITMAIELAPEEIFIEGDLFALNRIYRNLITNAVQATPPRGRILVRTLKQPDDVVIEVADTGCGIPADRLDSIFDDFVTTKRRGLGLGLAISKKVVEQMGGTIAVTSQVGVGSTFSVRFPLTAARPSQIAAM